MRLRNALLIAGAIVTLCAIAPAVADINYTQGSGTVIFDFVCFTTKHCPAHTNVNSAGTEIFTSSAPGQVTGANGTFPATQSGTWTVQPGNTANTTPWLASINDGTNTAKVQAASTAAAAADKSLVTNESPNSQLSTATGTTADAAWVSGSGTIVAILKNIANGVASSIAAGTAYIGQASPDPSKGGGTPSSVAINVSTATTTQLVAISGSTSIYVTSFDVIAGGTGNITFEYGTGVNCGTGTTALTGAYNLTAQAGISKGNGLGTILKVPSGNALCVLTTAAVQMSGSVSYQQF